MRVYKRGGVYWVDYFVGSKRVRQSTGTASRKEAVQWAANIETSAKAPTFEGAVEILRTLYGEQTQGAIRLDALWENYLRLAKATGKDSIESLTMTRRRANVARFIRWIGKKRPSVTTIEAVTGPVAAAYAASLASEGLKTKTRANVISELGTVWRLLEKASSRIRNPWDALTPRITDSKRGEAFTPEQEAAVLSAAKKVGKGWYEICQIMRLTGLRYGDVARMTWAEIGADAIRLKPHKTQRHGIEVTLPLIPELKAVIDSIPRTSGDFLFPVHSELYGSFGMSSRHLPFREVLDLAGVKGKGYSIHSWRHTVATRLAESGVNIETRKRILGHTEDVTARRYDHDDHLAEVKSALESAAKIHE